jgi:hypothetical protein
MDKRKAYALLHPTRDGRLAPGHRKRLLARYQTALWCDGERWHARVEFISSSFTIMPLVAVIEETRARMAAMAEQLLVGLDCGEGSVTILVLATAIEARRAMVPAERMANQTPTAA